MGSIRGDFGRWEADRDSRNTRFVIFEFVYDKKLSLPWDLEPLLIDYYWARRDHKDFMDVVRGIMRMDVLLKGSVNGKILRH